MASSASTMSGQLYIIQTTLPGDLEEFKIGSFCQELLESGAACVHYHQTKSMFSWEGSIQSMTEWRLQIKTGSQQMTSVLARAEALHPYDLPELVHWEIDAEKTYGSWIHSTS